MEVQRLRDDELQHHGVKGQRWGVRRYQNYDGSLTSAGKKKFKKLNKLQQRNAALTKHYNDNKDISSTYKSGDKSGAQTKLRKTTRKLTVSSKALAAGYLVGGPVISALSTELAKERYNNKTHLKSEVKKIVRRDNKSNDKSVQKKIAKNEKKINKIISQLENEGTYTKTTTEKANVGYKYLKDSYSDVVTYKRYEAKK
jgi:hypothetical protein